jgi:hypothetical protein
VSDRREHAEPELPDFDGDVDGEAIDLALVHADDEFLDLLGGARLDDGDGDDLGEFGDERLTELLMSWRRDVDAEPIDELVDPKLAIVTVQAAKIRRKHRPRLLVPLAAAAAVLAIVFAGVGLMARDAEPGDTLWALTKVLYADHARSVEAAQTVRADLQEARAALTEGNVAVAKSKLEDAHAALPDVTGEDGYDELEAQHASLLAQLPGNPSGEAGPPPDPDPTTQPDPGTDSSSDGGGSSDESATDPPENTTQPSVPSEDPTAPTEPTSPTETSSTDEPTRSDEGGEPGSTGGEPASVEEQGAASVNGVDDALADAATQVGN